MKIDVKQRDLRVAWSAGRRSSQCPLTGTALPAVGWAVMNHNHQELCDTAAATAAPDLFRAADALRRQVPDPTAAELTICIVERGAVINKKSVEFGRDEFLPIPQRRLVVARNAEGRQLYGLHDFHLADRGGERVGRIIAELEGDDFQTRPIPEPPPPPTAEEVREQTRADLRRQAIALIIGAFDFTRRGDERAEELVSAIEHLIQRHELSVEADN